MAQLRLFKFQEAGYENVGRFGDLWGAHLQVCHLVILAVKMCGLRKWLHSSFRERLRMPQFAGFLS